MNTLKDHRVKINMNCNLYISDALESIRLALLENENEKEKKIKKADDTHQQAISYIEKEKRDKILKIIANNEKRTEVLLNLKSNLEHIMNKRLKSKQKKKLNKLLPSILMELYSNSNKDQASNVNKEYLVVKKLERVVYKLKSRYKNMENSNDIEKDIENDIENDKIKQFGRALPFFIVYLVVMYLFVSYMQNKESIVLNEDSNCQNEYIWISDLSLSNSYYHKYRTALLKSDISYSNIPDIPIQPQLENIDFDTYYSIKPTKLCEECEVPSSIENSIPLSKDISSEIPMQLLENQVKPTKKVSFIYNMPIIHKPSKYKEILFKNSKTVMV